MLMSVNKSNRLLEQQDSEVTQVKLELAIETERIVNILNYTIHKIELVVCLPLLLQNNGEKLHLHLTKEEMSLVLETCSPYSIETDDLDISDEWESVSQQGTAKKEINTTMSWGSSFVRQSKSTGMPVEGRQDPEMCEVIQLLWSKPNVRCMVKELVLEVQSSGQLTSAASTFIKYFKQLQAFALERLSTSPFREHAREQYLRRLWHHNERVKAEIAVLSAKLEEQNNDIQLKLTAKNLLINQNEAKIERMNKKFKDDIKKRVYDSERKMVTDWKDSEFQQETLTNEVKILDAKMKSMLSTDLAQEKELRARRLKVETQLISWLNKYDADIGEKQAEYDDVLAGFEEEKRQMEELKEQFDAQQEEYESLMQEKADEEQAILEQKMYVFILNRSARRIQRYWRAYRARKLARRKARKKKKGGGSAKKK